MSNHVLIHALRALPDTESRSDALAALFLDLSPHEWRNAQAHLNSRDWRCDIIANLPVELVANIFAYLDTSTPFHLQRVSRQWRSLLQSSVVLKSCLNTWYHGNFRFQHFDYERYKSQARTLHNFRTGQTDEEEFRKILRPYATMLVDETLVGCLHDYRTLQVQNLRTGTSWQTHGIAREKITKLAVSTDLVAFATTKNTCYVSELSGGGKTSFKLPGNMFQAMTCHGRVVVCGGVLEKYAEIYMWDYDLRKGKSFRVGFDQYPFSRRDKSCSRFGLAILANSHDQNLIIFTNDLCTSSGCRACFRLRARSEYEIHYAQFNSDGQLLKHGKSGYLPSADFILHDLGGTPVSFQPADRCGGYSLLMMSQLSDTAKVVYFNEQQFAFVVPKQTFTLDNGEHFWASPKFASWEGIFYQASRQDDPLEEVELLCLGQRENMIRAPSRSWSREDFIDEEYRGSRLFLNDKFAVAITDDKYTYLHSFERKN